MKRQTPVKRLLSSVLTVMLSLLMGAGMAVLNVEAASGNIYTCSIHPCYAHPVTGTIEDSGGAASYATGQGMVEGAVYSTGLMEVTDSGEYYLTIRMSLVDYTTNHSFLVQEVGASGWSTPQMGVTGTGTDNNGTTADICIRVPSENCIVRGSMYVEPMGRDVIFYLYPDSYVAGNSTNMAATMVTEASAEYVQEEYETVAELTAATADEASDELADETSDELADEASDEPADELADETTDEAEAQTTADETTEASPPALQSSITTAAVPQAAAAATDGTLDSAQGLSLSTENAAAVAAEEEREVQGTGTQVVVLTTAITISGIILIAVAALVVYYFRRNWRRWGGYDEED